MLVDEKIRRGKGVDIERGRTGNVNSAPPGFPRRLIFRFPLTSARSTFRNASRMYAPKLVVVSDGDSEEVHISLRSAFRLGDRAATH